MIASIDEAVFGPFHRSHTMKNSIQLTLMLALALVSSGGAAPVVINNSSFESPALAADGTFVTSGFGTGTFNSWGYNVQNGPGFEDFGIENQGAGAYTGAAGAGTPLGADGINVAFLNNSSVGSTDSIFQDVGLLAPSTTYTLTIAIGQRLDRVNGSVQIALLNAASGNFDPFGTGTILASTTGVSSVNGSFQDFVTTFTTGAVVSNDLYVGARYTADGTIQASLDNVRLDATVVPEPSAVLTLLGGVGMLLSLRRSRRS